MQASDMNAAILAHGQQQAQAHQQGLVPQHARQMSMSLGSGMVHQAPLMAPPMTAAGAMVEGMSSHVMEQPVHHQQMSSQMSQLSQQQIPLPNVLAQQPQQLSQTSPPTRQIQSQSQSHHQQQKKHQQQDDEASAQPGVKHRRAPVACRRCRRLRSKCQHNNAKPPCIPCVEAGGTAPTECFFPARGEPDKDREFRRRRVKAADKSHGSEASRTSSASVKPSIVVNGEMSTSPSASVGEDRWDLLPPLDEVIEGCRVFFTSYFQLGFLPKAMFIEKLQKDKREISVFLLLSLLGISARFVPNLVKRYGGSVQATEIMIERARKLVSEEMYEPSLERIQGFFLLGIAEWGNGDKIRSSTHMGIAVRMAGITRLHREETYDVSKHATADDVVNSEVARRTFWVIISQESLHSGAMTPASFSLGDITALLPCDEGDFAFGRVPRERAALSGTLAAKYDDSLTWLPSRSLFATLIQVHTLWGQCARASTRQGERGPLTAPWQPSSRYAELAMSLQIWEENMPERHRWSLWNLRGYRSEALDLAYLAIVMVIRLSNIVIRRIYLEDIMNAKTGQGPDPAPPQFWDRMSIDLFTNVLELSEQIDAYFSLRSQEEGFPAIIVFCVYTCGSLAYYLCGWPHLCPTLGSRGPSILDRSMEVLSNLSSAWPLAMRWQQALSRVAHRPHGAVTGSLSAQGPPTEQYAEDGDTKMPRSQSRRSAAPNLDLLVNAAVQNNPQDNQQYQNHHTIQNTNAQQGFLNVDYSNPQFISPAAFPIDDFETELNAFLQGGETATFWNGMG